MEAADESNRLVHDSVEEAIREPVDEGAAYIAVNYRVRLWKRDDSIDHSTGFDEELVTESRSLELIPPIHCFNVARCDRAEYL